MDSDTLVDIARKLVAPGKGILAADESTGTIKRRFDSINIDCTEETRRDYRELLFRTEGIAEFLAGVILFDETIRQTCADGIPMARAIQEQGMIPGIKVDRGTHLLPGAAGELITEGLDGLRERLSEYHQIGARFAKWRAVIKIGPNLPSDYCVETNAHALARYAALSQEANLVPIVEPEVLIDGDHDIDRCFAVSGATLREVFNQLNRQRVLLEGILLKPSMVLSGREAPIRAEPAAVAQKTLACFKRIVPAAVPGIVFLSGGQADDEATANLNAINLEGSHTGAPWQLSFSFGRALQSAPMTAWAGNENNSQRAQLVFRRRAQAVSAARQGAFDREMAERLVLN